LDAAPLPGGRQHLGDGGLDAFVGIGDHELDATQTAPRELAQEPGPEGLGLRRADIHARSLTAEWVTDHNDVRPPGAIGHKAPISLINSDGVTSPPS
jgi:hypothetical protein